MQKITLGQITNIKTGKLDANAKVEGGKYPFFTCSKEISWIDVPSYDCECVLVAGNGDLNVKYYKGKFDAYQRTYIIESNGTEDLDMKYLYYFIEGYMETLRGQTIGGVIQYIKINNLTDIQIPLPPLATQRIIADKLDKLQSLIDLKKQTITKTDDLAKSIFLEMFGDPMVNEKGWEIKTIEQLISKEKYSLKRGPFGGALKKEIFVNSGYLVYEQFHALNNDFSMARYFIHEDKFKELKAFEVKPGDIIISCSGVYLGKLAIVPQNAKKGIINQALLKITLDEDIINKTFFVYVFSDNNFKSKFLGSGIGSGIPNLPPMQEFKKINFICPPLSLQQKFADIITKLEESKEKNKQALAKLEALYQSEMQRSFSL